MLHHGVPLPPPRPESSLSTSNNNEYIDDLEDNDTDKSMREEEEELPPCTPLQVALVGSFELAHREWTSRAGHAIVLKHTNSAR
jgi:hypothetical protein